MVCPFPLILYFSYPLLSVTSHIISHITSFCPITPIMATRSLHSLLGLLAAARAGQAAIRKETAQVFKTGNAFNGGKKTEKYIDPDEEALMGKTEVTQVVTSVNSRLSYDFKSTAHFLNLSATIDKGNTTAKADVMIDGEAILSGVPATTLLSLQGQIEALIELTSSAPVRDSKTTWKQVPDEEHLFEREAPRITGHQKDKTIAITLAPATDKHAAQAQLIKERVTVMVTTEFERSSAFSSTEKAKLLARLSKWKAALAEALATANAQTVEEAAVGTTITDDLIKTLSA